MLRSLSSNKLPSVPTANLTPVFPITVEAVIDLLAGLKNSREGICFVNKCSADAVCEANSLKQKPSKKINVVDILLSCSLLFTFNERANDVSL